MDASLVSWAPLGRFFGSWEGFGDGFRGILGGLGEDFGRVWGRLGISEFPLFIAINGDY